MPNLMKCDSFTLEHIIREISDMDIYKSSGIFNISSRILKDTWTIATELLYNILNKSISKGIFPDAWKIGTIIPIPKVPYPQQVTDLRPITLFPLPGKILERLIHNKMYPYLENHKILSKYQNGFRKHPGTTDTIFKFISDITDNFNHKNITLGIFYRF